MVLASRTGGYDNDAPARARRNRTTAKTAQRSGAEYAFLPAGILLEFPPYGVDYRVAGSGRQRSATSQAIRRQRISRFSGKWEDTVKFQRRQFLRLAAGVVAVPAVSRVARAQTYPARPVRMIVGFPAGNASDIIARLLAQSLSERLGQQFIVENRPGAGGSIGTEVVVRAAPDGYTLLMSVVTSNAINATYYTNLNYDFIRDIAPVASIGDGSYVMVVNPSIAAKTLPEFIAYAKANPGKINMASTGNGTPTHVFGELFKMMAGVDLLHVPYRGSFLPDLLGGQVQVVFGPIAQFAELIQSGKLRALAVTAATGQATLPNIPTIAEFVPGYDASVRYGIVAPGKTPGEIVDKLNKEINAALADPRMKARLADIGAIPMPMTPAEFGSVIAAETEKWGKVIRTAHIQAG
jgi:tripartite-type tricarboxylate transporter receptor subunit TctC